ncbi:hypothetical protein IFM89_005179, partial [Coptis chinensis]
WYHPSRVLTLVYQPFALGTLAIFAYNEVDLATSGKKGGLRTFIAICAMSGAFGVADAHVQGGMIGDLSLMCPGVYSGFLLLHFSNGFLLLLYICKKSFILDLVCSHLLLICIRSYNFCLEINYKKRPLKILQMDFAWELIILCLEKTKIMRSMSVFAGKPCSRVVFCNLHGLRVLMCALYAFVFPKLPIVKHYRSKAASERSQTVTADLAAGGIQALPNEGVLTYPVLWKVFYDDKERPNRYLLAKEQISRPDAEDMEIIFGDVQEKSDNGPSLLDRAAGIFYSVN